MFPGPEEASKKKRKKGWPAGLQASPELYLHEQFSE